MIIFSLTTVVFPSISNHLYIIHLEADKSFPFVVQIWCVSFPFSAEMQGCMQDSSFVHLIIYLPFHKELYSTFNINISKILFTILLSFSSSGWLSEV